MEAALGQTRNNGDKHNATQGEPVYGLGQSEVALQPQMTQLAGRIERAWQTNSTAKQPIERELLQCLRDRKGVYSPEEYQVITEQGSSDIFMKLPQVKIRAAEAHIRSILLPADDMAFGVDPTPVQTLPSHMEEAIINRVVQNQQRVDNEGQPVDVIKQVEMLQHMVREEVERQAKQACDRMTLKIRDQLTEGGWEKAMRALVADLVTFPAAIFKGPVFENRPMRRYVQTPNGLKLNRSIERKMVFKTISPFDGYPSPEAETPQDGDFLERLRFTRGELHALLGTPGYNDNAIKEVLAEYGRSGLVNWLWTDNQRANLENKEYYWMHSGADQIDALHFYGRAQGLELIEWGMSKKIIADELADYEIDAIKIGRHVIRAVINHDPMFRRPIHRACYEQVPGSFWGNSVSYLMRDITRMCNGAARQLQNNMAHSSGLQIDVNFDRLSPETNPFDIYPNKLWQFTSSEFGSNDRGVTFFQPDSNAQELMFVYNEFAPQADDATGIPRFAHGNDNVGGAGDTARGLSMLMDSSAKMLRSSISNVDCDVIQPCVTMVYDHNMEHDPDESIKRDAQVVARGATAMLQRESAREAQMQLLELTANEIDMEIIGTKGRAHMLRELVNTFPSIPREVVPTVEQVAQMEEEKSAEPPPPELLKIEADKEIAQAKLQQDGQINQMKLQSVQEIELMKVESQREMEQQRMQIEREKVAADGQIALEREDIIQRFRLQGVQEQIKAQSADKLAEISAQKEADGDEEPISEETIKQVVTAEIEPLIKRIEDLSNDQVKVLADLVVKLSDQLGKVATKSESGKK